VVLSNNDGCIVARSAEAKALGLKMGEPYFKVRELLERHKVAVFSSNYALYGAPRPGVGFFDHSGWAELLVLDGTGAPPMEYQTIIIENSRIKSIGQASEISLSGVAQTAGLSRAAYCDARKEFIRCAAGGLLRGR
jgi:hypothetical protein